MGYSKNLGQKGHIWGTQKIWDKKEQIWVKKTIMRFRVYILEIIYLALIDSITLHSRMNPGQPRSHYLIPDDTFIDKFIHLLNIYYSLAKILLATSQILLKFYFTS